MGEKMIVSLQGCHDAVIELAFEVGAQTLLRCSFNDVDGFTHLLLYVLAYACLRIHVGVQR
jgi:hypothetical protein